MSASQYMDARNASVLRTYQQVVPFTMRETQGTSIYSCTKIMNFTLLQQILQTQK